MNKQTLVVVWSKAVDSTDYWFIRKYGVDALQMSMIQPVPSHLSNDSLVGAQTHAVQISYHIFNRNYGVDT